MDTLAIEMRNVHKTFGSRKILKGMNIKVKKGETMVILGPSGTGKSVSLKHLTGLLDPDEGECFIFGESISHAEPGKKESLRSKLGVLFQSGALINWLTVNGFEVNDFGTYSAESADYADFAHPVASAVEQGEFEKGILLTNACRI